jgi:holo-[acyl-carrier protein] synthase
MRRGPEPRVIIGVGADLCDIRRIRNRLDRFGDRFKNSCFTEIERTRSDRKPDRGLELRQALRGQGGLRQGARHRHARGVYWKDMGVVNLPAASRPWP